MAKPKVTHPARAWSQLRWLALALTACVSDAADNESNDEYDALEDMCRPDAGAFSSDIDSEWFPMPVGSLRVLEGDDDGIPVRVEIRALDETEVVAGVTTRVLEERTIEDGQLHEVARNFFARTADGTVCYFGEDVDFYEDGEVVNHEGQWRAGMGDNLPGIIMPAEPMLGMSYAQEIAIDDEAWGHGSHVAEGEEVAVPAGSYTDTIRVLEWSPIHPEEVGYKVYVRGFGIIIDDDTELVSYEE